MGGGIFMKKMATESQTPKGTQYRGGWNFFLPDFNIHPYSLRSQGDNLSNIILEFYLSLKLSERLEKFGKSIKSFLIKIVHSVRAF